MVQEDKFIKQTIDRYDRDIGMLIPIMQDLQAKYGYLPSEKLRCLARQLKVSLSRLYAVATFYSSFRLAPKGAHEVTLCMGTVCYLKGAGRICEAITKEFRVEPGDSTQDRLFSFQAVNCVGACAVAPVMLIDGKYYESVTPASALEILHGLYPKKETSENESEA
jgi:NADH:ubiquinone oxidoreductase subunit E